MRAKHSQDDNPEIQISFAGQNQDINREQTRLNAQILRVHTIDKNRTLLPIFNMPQQQLCQFFTNYQPFPHAPLDLQRLLDSPKLKLIKNDGKIYFGQVHNKRKEGSGVYCQREGKIYQGQFYNNQKHGKGVQVYSNGNLYIGRFTNNKKHGEGVFYWFSLNSQSTHNISANQQQPFIQYYQGQWWGGLPDGKGIHHKVNGDCYTGLFKNGLKHGQGEQYYGNGDHYRGQYVNGMPQGFGQYLWADRNSYKGDFKQGQRNGYGVWDNGSKKTPQSYKGHYRSDKKTGYGVYEWSNGWVYKGNFDNDYRNGYGVLYDNQGNVKYKGFWQNGIQTHQKQLGNSRISKYQRQSNYKYDRETNAKSQYDGTLSAKVQDFVSRSKGDNKMHMNRQDMGLYATMSHYGQNNLCRRPGEGGMNNFYSSNMKQSHWMADKSNNWAADKGNNWVGDRSGHWTGDGEKRRGRIGTSINRPLMQSSKSQHNFRVMSSRKY